MYTRTYLFVYICIGMCLCHIHSTYRLVCVAHTPTRTCGRGANCTFWPFMDFFSDNPKTQLFVMSIRIFTYIHIYAYSRTYLYKLKWAVTTQTTRTRAVRPISLNTGVDEWCLPRINKKRINKKPSASHTSTTTCGASHASTTITLKTKVPHKHQRHHLPPITQQRPSSLHASTRILLNCGCQSKYVHFRPQHKICETDWLARMAPSESWLFLVPRTLNKNCLFPQRTLSRDFFGPKNLRQNPYPRRALSRKFVCASTRFICRLGSYCTRACRGKQGENKRGNKGENKWEHPYPGRKDDPSGARQRRRAPRYVSEGAPQCAAGGGLLLPKVLACQCELEIALSGLTWSWRLLCLGIHSEFACRRSCVYVWCSSVTAPLSGYPVGDCMSSYLNACNWLWSYLGRDCWPGYPVEIICRRISVLVNWL